MYKFAWETLKDEIKEQIRNKGFKYENDILNVDSEFYAEAADSLLNYTFTHEEKEYMLCYNEDVWIVEKLDYTEEAWEAFII
jgi:hypothetical protein